MIILLCSCSGSKDSESDVDIKYRKKLDAATKYYNENKFDSAYSKIKEIVSTQYFMEYLRYCSKTPNSFYSEKTVEFYNKLKKLGKECEQKTNLLLINKCLESIDNKNYSLAHYYEDKIPKYSKFSEVYDCTQIDSLNYAIGLRLFGENEHNQAIMFFSKIEFKKSRADLILPILIEIGNKAVDNNDAIFATKVLAFLMKEFWGNQKYINDIERLGTKFDELRNLNELKKFTDTHFEINGVAFNIKSAANWSNDNEFMQPRNGFKYYVLDIILINIDSQAKYINTIGFYLTDDEGYKYETSGRGKKPNLINGYLLPGEKTRGYLTFEILNNTNRLDLNYIFYK
jgi:hypothetical protein